jgi:cytochrome c-type biogenesis protein CcmE
MTRKSRRLVLIASAVAVIGVAVGLVLFALRGNVSFFYSPTEYAEKAPPPGTRLSVGGLVKNDTVVKSADKTVTFTVTDTNKDVRVAYTGLSARPVPGRAGRRRRRRGWRRRLVPRRQRAGQAR